MKKLLVITLILFSISFIKLYSQTPKSFQADYIQQLNILRIEHGRKPLEHNKSANLLASRIHEGYTDYEEIFDEMVTLGLSAGGKYFTHWTFDLSVPMVKQINELEDFDKQHLIHNDAIYWGYHIDSEKQEYLLTLIYENPLFTTLFEKHKEIN